jgi:hypothetical protein
MVWRDLNLHNWPNLWLLHSIPNGGKRSVTTAVSLKNEGVLSGVCDLFLPVARCGYHGLYIEMKHDKVKPKSVISATQKKFLAATAEEGYLSKVCYNDTQAINLIEEYISGKYNKRTPGYEL